LLLCAGAPGHCPSIDESGQAFNDQDVQLDQQQRIEVTRAFQPGAVQPSTKIAGQQYDKDMLDG
jgi:hypothetical protein